MGKRQLSPLARMYGMADGENFVKVARKDAIPPGQLLAVEAGELEIVLYNVNGTLHATRDSCTHQNHPLSKGELRGKYIKCTLHGWEYDVTNGTYQGNPEICVGRFPVKTEGDDVYVGTVPIPAAPRDTSPPPFVSRDDA